MSLATLFDAGLLDHQPTQDEIESLEEEDVALLGEWWAAPSGTVEKDFDPDKHPRGGNPQNTGQFSHAGGAGGSATRNSTTNFSSREEAESKLSALLGATAQVKVEEVVGKTANTHLMEAAQVTYDILEKMKAAGYEMPTDLEVMVDDTDSPVGTESNHSRITVGIPYELPPEISLDKAVKMTYPEGEYTTRNMRDIVIHEMGHLQAGERYHQQFESAEELSAAEKVSNYAASNHDEFLAESFTRLYNGGKLEPEAQALYDKLKGPKIL